MQSITGLGSFDINDIISNTLGAIIGFIIYKKVFSSKISIRSFIVSAIIIIISLISIMVVSELASKILIKTPGEIQSITDFEEINNEFPQVKDVGISRLKYMWQ